MKRIIQLLALAIAISSFVPPANAERRSMQPIAVGWAITIDADQLSQLMNFPTGMVIVDVREMDVFSSGHIPTAIPIGTGSLTKARLAEIAPNKHNRIVFYSEDAWSDSSLKAVETALFAGYTNVLWLRDGFKQWTEHGFRPVSAL